jgi:2-dehydropantoate 2-reductase
MDIAIIGAGGLGGYFGALLARAGENVSVVTRGAQLAAIHTSGLTIKGITDGFTVRVNAAEDAASVGPVDAVLFCVKSYDVDEAVRLIPPLLKSSTMVLPLQNGVDTPDHIKNAISPESVLGGVAYVSVAVESPGVILHSAVHPRIQFGELAGGTTKRTEALSEALTSAGIDCTIEQQIRSVLWEKFVGMTAFGGVPSVARCPLGPVLADPITRKFFRDTMIETASVGTAAGIKLDPDLPDRMLAFQDQQPPQSRSSMQLDLENGRRIELEALNGAAVRLGAAHHVPTPNNFAIYAALRPSADGRPAQR